MTFINQKHRNGKRNSGNAGNEENVVLQGMSQTFREKSANIPGNILKHSG